ncbi:FAD-dependent oxidoreductase [Altererythrobacter aestuarii]|uniref:FAD-dependent oxidoreductase n=1 Tax=Alteraurantiacibacter aestuarii TaxID=650004 RepID=A0A844ZJG1_9SPHN|nr:FAD-dependent oxidoreductase [Alteraurantiacibacter aestuarii]
MHDLVVIGAGAMGLAAAWRAANNGIGCLVLEAGPVAGGMAAHFDFGGISLERYYHFICQSDHDTFALLEELGLADTLVWKRTTMGYFDHGKVHDWGNPLALLKYPHLGPIEKLRYGLLAWWCTKRPNWDGAEHMTAPEWLKEWLGQSGYDKMWHRLLHQKFFQYTDVISATWIGTRISRIGRSRKSLMEERLGHLEGGTQTLVDALVAGITQAGSEVRCSAPVAAVTVAENDLKRVELGNGEVLLAREVISTVPTPVADRIFPGLSPDEHAKLAAIENIGVICLVYRLKKPVTGHFWVNIMDKAHPIPGLIEFSALRDFGGDTIIYAPYYMPHDNERWDYSDEALLDDAFAAIKAVNPQIGEGDVIDRNASRLKYSQPICTPNFLDKLPPVETSLPGVQIADTSYYYPEDRGISESVGLGARLAETAMKRLGNG